MDERGSGEAQRPVERCRREGRDVCAALGKALVVGQPGLPGRIWREGGEDRGLAVRNGPRRVRDIGERGGGGDAETEALAGCKIEGRQVRRAAAGAGERPVVEAAPAIGAGFEGGNPGEVRRGRALQILVKERDHQALAEPARGVGSPIERAEPEPRVIGLAVGPGTEDQPSVAAALQRAEQRGCAVNVLLVPRAGDDQRRNGEGTAGENAVERLFLPVGVIGRVLGQPLPEGQPDHPQRAAIGAGRAVAQRREIIVGDCREPLAVGLAAARLAEDVADQLLAEGAVVEPVVALPDVDHWIDRDARLERGVGVHEAHQGGEAVVAGAEGADAAIAFRHVADQPVDGVPGIGRMVDRGSVERSA